MTAISNFIASHKASSQWSFLQSAQPRGQIFSMTDEVRLLLPKQLRGSAENQLGWVVWKSLHSHIQYKSNNKRDDIYMHQYVW